MTDYLQNKIDLSGPLNASIVDELSFWSSRFGSILFDNLTVRPNINILDVGCANGFPLFELAHVFGRTCRVTGIDIWSDSIERARFKLGLYALTNVEIVETDAGHQPFDDATFDLIVSNVGINNWADPRAVLTECRRVAKPGAELVLTSNLVGHYQEFYEVFQQTLIELKMSHLLDALEAQRRHRGTRESISEVLSETGWRIGKVIEDSFQMRFADGHSLLNHSLTRYGFLDGWRGVVGGVAEEQVFAAIEIKLDAIAQEKGELRMTVPMIYVESLKTGLR